MKPILALFLLLTLFSCRKDSVEDFAGTWIGTFTGAEDNGTFTIVVMSDGTATGTMNSQVFLGESFQLMGGINARGTIGMTFGTGLPDGNFLRTLKGNSGIGNWENTTTSPVFKGLWTGHKQ